MTLSPTQMADALRDEAKHEVEEQIARAKAIRKPTSEALAMVGTVMKYDPPTRGTRRRTVVGLVIGVRPAVETIVAIESGETWRAVRFLLLRPDDWSTVWTCPFPDGPPVPKEAR